MRKRAIGMLALVSAATIMTSSANACPNCKKGYVFGQPVAIGNGMGFTWAKYNKETKKLESVGLTLTETALEGLPKVEDLKGPEPMEMWMLELPKEVKGFPFEFVSVGWVPVGHPPVPLYDKPHFDFHFFTIDPKTVNGITATGTDLAKCKKVPARKFVPAGYILPPDTIVPNMGAHWINPSTSPEVAGKLFTSTFLYGTYNGQTSFWEPMITKAFLESKPDFTQAIAPPKAFEKDGYYPSSYSVKYNADRHEYNISLDGLFLGKADSSATLEAPTKKLTTKKSKVGKR